MIPSRSLSRKARLPLICATSIALFAATAHSQTVIKENNLDDLNLTSSWIGALVPGAGDIAVWNSSVTAANTVLLGADSIWAGIRILDPAGAVTINAGNMLTLGANGIDLSLATQNLTLNNTVALGTAQSWNVGEGRTLTVAGAIGGAGIGFTKIGAGTLTLGGANTYTGATAINQGTLVLDFAAATAPVADILSASSPLQMGGGSLSFVGAAGAANTQAVAGTTFNAGLNQITVTPGAGGTASLGLGSFTHVLNTTVRFNSTGSITGATASTTTGGLLGVQAGALGINVASAGYATFGLDDFAAFNAGVIVPGTSVAAFYQNVYGLNFDMLANTGLANGGAQRGANVVRWNTPAATTLTAGTSNLVTFTSALITPNMGANNSLFAGGAGAVWQVIRSTNPNGAQQGTIWQNNPLGFFTISLPIVNGREGAPDPTHVVKAGAGTAVFSGTNTYTGRTSIYEGALMVTADANLGAAGTPISLAGGTLFGNASFAVGATRGITVTGTGGLAASTGNTLNVGNLIGGTGQVVIGSGTLAGTGAGTANPTDIVGNGTVVLSANNFYFGGTAIQAGTLNINGINALGGANYGGLAINGGALQYASTLTSDADLTAGKGIRLGASGGTIDTNGNSVSYAAGLTGAGAFTKAGTGTLTLNAAGTYAGGTIINGGTLKVASTLGSATGAGAITVNNLGTLAGTGTIDGAVTINAGGTLDPGASVGTLTLPGLTLSLDSLLKFEFNISPANDQVLVTGTDALTLNGGKFTVVAEGTANPWSTVGTYNLLSFNGTIQGTGTSALSVINPAAGFSYDFGASGGFVTLTVATSGLITNWTAVGGGTWTDSGNWSNGVADAVGTIAGFGSAITGPATITLDGGKTIGGATFENANSYTIATGTGGSLTLQKTTGSADLMVFSGSHTISAPIVLASNLAADIGTASSLTISAPVSGARSITKRGAGVLALSAANTHSLGTILEAGTLDIGDSAALGTSTLGITANATLRAGVDALAPANAIILSSGVAATIDTQAHTFTVAGIVSDTAGNGALHKAGSGTLILAGANTYGGSTTVDAGILSVAALADGGLPSGIGQSPFAAASLVLNGGTLLYTGADATTDRLLTVGIAGATLDASGTGAISFINPGALALTGADIARTLTLSGTHTGINTLAPVLANSASGVTSLIKTGTGTWSISGTNTFTGNTIISGGTLALGNALALQSSTLDYNNQGGALSFDALPAATLGGLIGAQDLALTNVFVGPVALTVGGNNAANIYFGVLSGTGSLTKVGNGVLTLAGVNTFTGPATINGGALRLATSDALLGTSQLFINVAGGLLLSNGVVANMPITATTGAGEFVDVPEAGAAATLGGTLTAATGGNQYRLGISGAGAVLTITGAHNVPGAGNISFITRGNIVFAGTGSLNINTANDTFQFGRFTGQALNVTFKDSATLTSGAIGFGGGQAGGPVTLTIQDTALVGALLGKNFDFHGINANVATTINLNGGTLLAGSFTKFQQVAGRDTFLNLNGGTLAAGASNINFLPALPGLIATVQSGGVKIDTLGFDVTIAQPFIHDAGIGLTPDGGLDKQNAGTLTLTGANTYTGPTSVSGGTLHFGAAQTLAALNIAAVGTASIAPHAGGPAAITPIDATALTITAGGKLDLANNALVVRGGDIGDITDLVASGSNGLAWDGAGINSSTAFADANFLTGVGVINNAEYGYTDFANVAGLTGTEILVKYTYYGDSDLSGQTTADDFTLFFDGFTGAQPASWLYGDYDYDGAVTVDDFTLFVSSLNSGGPALAPDGGDAPSAPAAVPEPGSLALLLAGALGLLRRRR